MKKSHALFVACLVTASHASALHASAQRVARPAPRVKVERRADPASSAERTDAQVERIFQRFLDAQGGRAAMAAVKTRIMRGTVVHSAQPGLPGSLEYYSKAPDKALTLVALPGGQQFIQAYDGRTDWMSNPLTGSIALDHAPFVLFDRGSDFGRMPRASEMYASVAYKGTATVGGREAHVVAAARAGHLTQTLYFDASSGLLVRSVVGFREPVERKEIPVTINYGAYAKVDGVMIPTALEHVFPAFTITFTIYEVKHNVAIDDSMFERPAPAATKPSTDK